MANKLERLIGLYRECIGVLVPVPVFATDCTQN